MYLVKSLPFGSKVKVTNKKNGHAVTVTITDRGPYVKGRCILEIVGTLARMHLAPTKFKRDAAEADPLIAIAGGGGVNLFNSQGNADAARPRRRRASTLRASAIPGPIRVNAAMCRGRLPLAPRYPRLPNASKVEEQV